MKLSFLYITFFRLVVLTLSLSISLFIIGVFLYQTNKPANCSEYGTAVIDKIEVVNAMESIIYYRHYVKGERIQKSELRKMRGQEERLSVGDSIDVIYACDNPAAGRVVPLQ